MLTLPPLLIVTDRGHFVAYHPHGGSGPEVIDHATFTEGTSKLSEQVTDKAGGFPSGESLGQGNSSAERLPLEHELDLRCLRQISQRIQDILANYPGPWGLAAPPEINNAILDLLPREVTARLHLNLAKNLSRVPAPDVIAHFVRASEEAHALT